MKISVEVIDLPKLVLFLGMAALLVRLRAQGSTLLRFDSFSTLMWAFSLGVGLLPLVDFSDRYFDWYSAALIGTCQLALVVGFRSRVRSSSVAEPAVDLTVAGARWFPWLALGFSFFQIGLRLAGGEIPVISPAMELQERRLAHLEGGGLTIASQLAIWLQYLAVPAVLLLPVYLKMKDRVRVGLSLLAIVAILDISVGVGGRATIVLMVVALAATFAATFQVSVKLVAFGAIFGFVSVMVLGVYFVSERNRDFAADPQVFLSFSCGAQFSEQVASANDQWKALAFSSCYFASPPHNLSDFLASSELATEPKAGLYNLGRIFQSDFADIRTEIATDLAKQGRSTNPWSTSVRDFWIDFGPWSPLLFALLGRSAGAIYMVKAAWESRMVLQAWLVASAFLIPFLSPLIIPIAVYPILATIVLDSLDALNGRRRRPVGSVSRAAVTVSP